MAETLPSEILCQIFEYLPLSDRLACSTVSKHFNEAFRISNPKLQEKTFVTFESDEQVLRLLGQKSHPITKILTLCLLEYWTAM